MFGGVEQEERTNFHQQGLGQAIEEDKRQGYQDLRLAEEGCKGSEGCAEGDVGAGVVGLRAGQEEEVDKEENAEGEGGKVEGVGPSPRRGETEFERSGQHDDEPLPDNGGNAVGGGTDADKEGLFAGIEGEEVEAVGGYVVSSAAEGYYPEHGQ